MLVIRQVYSSPLQPFNYNYTYFTNDTTLYNTSITMFNTYKGGAYQQSISALTVTDQTAYDLNGGGYSVYGYEYKPGFDNAARNLSYGHPRLTEFRQYITWVSNNQLSWTVFSSAMGADPTVETSARPIPQEPMVCIL